MTADVATDSPLAALVRDRRVIVCAGSGGVGKTTTAAALAVAAARAGRRVVVVTIDPARRLADALGVAELAEQPQDDPHVIEGPWTGSLAAVMLDTKATFDGLVSRYAADAAQRDRILANRFYRNISHALSGTQEYMAAEKLYELWQRDDVDLVVVDTPPSRHALDFLDAPDQLARLLDHRVYRVLTAPGRGVGKVVNRAAQTVVRTVGRVVGAAVLDDAVAFFAAFEGMEEGFRQRSARVRGLLGSSECAFVLVIAPRADTVGEADHVAARLAEHRISVAALIANRVTPDFTPASTEPAWTDLDALRAEATARATTGYGRLLENLADLLELRAGEEREIAALAARVQPAPVVRVPLLPHDVHDLDTLAELADVLLSARGGR